MIFEKPVQLQWLPDITVISAMFAFLYWLKTWYSMIKQISTKVLIFFHNHKQIKSNNVCISLGRLFTSIIYQLVRVCFLLHHLCLLHLSLVFHLYVSRLSSSVPPSTVPGSSVVCSSSFPHLSLVPPPSKGEERQTKEQTNSNHLILSPCLPRFTSSCFVFC